MTEAVAPEALPAEPAAERKKRFELTLFALPHAPLGALGLPPIVFLPPYYAAQLGIPLETVSALFLAARALDIVIDPLLGEWQDRTRHKFGRRKIWMACSTPLLMLAVWFAFIGVGPGVNAFGLAGVIFGLYALFAVLIIAHLGWASELRADYHGRTNVLGGVQLAAMFGATLILALPALVVQSGWGDNADAVHVMGWTILITLPICVALALFNVHEPDIPVHEKISFKSAMRAIVTNAYLRAALVPDLLLAVAQGVSGGLFLFYFQYALGFAREAQTLLFIYFISGVAGVPIWVWIGRRIGKHRALQCATLYAALVTVGILLVPAGQFGIAAAMMAVAGLHQGAGNLLLRAMIADVIDADQIKTGRARAGLFNSLMLITSKAGLATGPITYAILALYGFQTDLGGANSPAAMGALTWMFVGVTATLYVVTAISLVMYKLDENVQRALRAEIDARASPNRAQSQ